MKRSHSIFIFFLSVSLFSCAKKEIKQAIEVKEVVQKEKKVQDERVGIPTGDNSQVSLDWSGTYTGILPCANCEGIETTLTLNPDLTYILVTNYLGRNDALEEENSGPFSWDSTGSTITLLNIKSGLNQYKVGENRIWHLDINGERITGDLADHYILIKK